MKQEEIREKYKDMIIEMIDATSGEIMEDIAEEDSELALLMFDTKTRQIVDGLNYGEFMRIMRKTTLEYLKEKKEREEQKALEEEAQNPTRTIGRNNTYSLKFNASFMELISENLTNKQWSVLIVCSANFAYKTGMVSHNNGKPMTIEQIAEKAKLTTRSASETINVLIKKKIISKDRKKDSITYYMNPWIFYKPSNWKITEELYKRFEDSKWKTVLDDESNKREEQVNYYKALKDKCNNSNSG